MIELYHFESCPYCQKVRLKLEGLGLDYISHPSPKGSRNREFLKRFSEDLQFPLLVDTEKNIYMLESDDICAYLEREYGNRKEAR
jgi:glutathione S-transferase